MAEHGKAVMAVEEVQTLRKKFDAHQATNHQQPFRKKANKDLYCAFHGCSLHSTEQYRNIQQQGYHQAPRPHQVKAEEVPHEPIQERMPPVEHRQDVP